MKYNITRKKSPEISHMTRKSPKCCLLKTLLNNHTHDHTPNDRTENTYKRYQSITTVGSMMPPYNLCQSEYCEFNGFF
jgi:hypothetical protein